MIHFAAFLNETTEPQIVYMRARKRTDASKQGIHLLNPTRKELDDAHDQAIRDGFGAIYIHTKRTWPMRGAL